MEKNYYYDFEFLEGTQTKKILGIPVGKTLPTIQPISVGIVSSDNREYYAIFNDFNLDEAWNRWQYNTDKKTCDIVKKIYWIRENVLKPIHLELLLKKSTIFLSVRDAKDVLDKLYYYEPKNMFKELKFLIKKYGKSKEQIASEIVDFIYPDGVYEKSSNSIIKPNLFGFYSGYDHVCLCWLYGKMIDLPTGLPYYTIDLQQECDRIYNEKKEEYYKSGGNNFILKLSNHPKYPRQTNEHNALADARWNRDLHNFLKTL